MKLIVTIPAYNEEKTIGNVIKEIPRNVDGVDEVEILVINDGSTDETVIVSKEAGADYIIDLKENKGLAFAFRTGLEEALKKGADLIVNTDGDFQYNQNQVKDLIKPILENKADIVLGSRFKGNIEHMVFQKKLGNQVATAITRKTSGYPVSDAQTGFRAFSREAALRMNVLSNYTYVQETIMQAVNHKLTITEIPIDFRMRDGSSRLMKGVFHYASRASSTILRTYRDYQPLKVFSGIGIFLFLVGSFLGIGVLYHYFRTGMVSPHLPSAVLATLLWLLGSQFLVFGLLADMLKNQRIVQDEILYRIKKIKFESADGN